MVLLALAVKIPGDFAIDAVLIYCGPPVARFAEGRQKRYLIVAHQVGIELPNPLDGVRKLPGNSLTALQLDPNGLDCLSAGVLTLFKELFPAFLLKRPDTVLVDGC